MSLDSEGEKASGNRREREQTRARARDERCTGHLQMHDDVTGLIVERIVRTSWWKIFLRLR